MSFGGKLSILSFGGKLSILSSRLFFYGITLTYIGNSYFLSDLNGPYVTKINHPIYLFLMKHLFCAFHI